MNANRSRHAVHFSTALRVLAALAAFSPVGALAAPSVFRCEGKPLLDKDVIARYAVEVDPVSNLVTVEGFPYRSVVEFTPREVKAMRDAPMNQSTPDLSELRIRHGFFMDRMTGSFTYITMALTSDGSPPTAEQAEYIKRSFKAEIVRGTCIKATPLF